MDAFMEEREDHTVDNRIIYGRTMHVGATTGDSVWQIWANDYTGNARSIHFAENIATGEPDAGFIHSWDNRQSLFDDVDDSLSGLYINGLDFAYHGEPWGGF